MMRALLCELYARCALQLRLRCASRDVRALCGVRGGVDGGARKAAHVYALCAIQMVCAMAYVLSVGCTGAYDQSLPMQFTRGDFVAHQVGAELNLYRVEADGSLRPSGSKEVAQEILFDGRENVALWSFSPELLRLADSTNNRIEAFGDRESEIEVSIEASCDCVHPVLPSLMVLAPGASCPLPRAGQAAGAQYEWDGSGWSVRGRAEAQLYVRRTSMAQACQPMIEAEDFVPRVGEQWMAREVDLSSVTGTVGEMFGVVGDDERFFVTGTEGWVAVDESGAILRWARWGDFSISSTSAIANTRSGYSYLLTSRPELGALGLGLWTLSPDLELGLRLADGSVEATLGLPRADRGPLVLLDELLLVETVGGWHSLTIEGLGEGPVHAWVHPWPGLAAATDYDAAAGQGTWSRGDNLRVFSSPAVLSDDLKLAKPPQTETADLSVDLVLDASARAALLTGAHRIAYEASRESWRFDRLAPEGHTEVAPTNFAHTVAAPGCVPSGTPTQVLVGDKRVLGVWEDGTMALAGAADCLTSAFENPRAAVRATAFTHSGRHIAALSTDDRLTLFAQRLQEGSQ